MIKRIFKKKSTKYKAMMRFLVKIYVILVDSIRENGDSWNPLYHPVENSKLFIIYFLSGS